MSRTERQELLQIVQDSDETMAWVERKSARATRRENARKYRREED